MPRLNRFPLRVPALVTALLLVTSQWILAQQNSYAPYDMPRVEGPRVDGMDRHSAVHAPPTQPRPVARGESWPTTPACPVPGYGQQSSPQGTQVPRAMPQPVPQTPQPYPQHLQGTVPYSAAVPHAPTPQPYASHPQPYPQQAGYPNAPAASQQPPYSPKAQPRRPEYRQALHRPVAEPTPLRPAPPLAPKPLKPAVEFCEGAQKVGQVGSEAITYNEIMSGTNEWVKKNKGTVPEEQIRMVLEGELKKRLKVHVETMLVYCDARNSIPAENLPKVEESIGKHFETTVVPKLIKSMEVGSRRELEEKMSSSGTSLTREKLAFVKRTLAQQWAHEQMKSDKEITYDEMMAYYQDHLKDYEHAAKVRWEEVMVSTSTLSEPESRRKIAELGNMLLRGAPLAEVARKSSDGLTASKGGERDWTNQGSLVCEELDRALFGLPIGQLSRIIKSDSGHHIVRVLERKDAGRTPFVEAQADIRKTIQQRRRMEAQEDYLARLKRDIPVWTIFDKEKPVEQIGSRPNRLQR